MDSMPLTDSLVTLMSELVKGAPDDGAYVLNRGDAGLLRSLDRLSAGAASSASHGGGTIAAHVEHLRYGLSLLNRWSAGENPFADADWSRSWETTSVTEDEWSLLRRDLRSEAEQWLDTLGEARNAGPMELNGVIGSIVHLAYHLGALRQIHRSARGPTAND
jgi:hypothetical protein